MPRLDGTGPRNEGSKTGRGLGKCSDKKENGSGREENQERGRGRGREENQGRGKRVGLNHKAYNDIDDKAIKKAEEVQSDKGRGENRRGEGRGRNK